MGGNFKLRGKCPRLLPCPLYTHVRIRVTGLYFYISRGDSMKAHDAYIKSPFPSLKAHGATLISVSLALSRTPAEAARPRIRG